MSKAPTSAHAALRPRRSLPSAEDLRARADALGCVIRYGSCRTHGGSVLHHDGGRSGCRVVWSVPSAPARLEAAR